ncbi:CinA family protein [Roseburia sp. 1XD42-69]|uniref:CinA family protein n=1 Tax=Roseburia sp. 1XD42-69 TaxID=2320088 RepID=UPI000EA0AE76|nr:CinA family protein [Roseburia sp. 1XD42-69]RKJ68506.1 CinA family protein [Roseburia sp. 1XD42-69]
MDEFNAREEKVAALLKEKGLKVTTAESCTGGLIAGTLVNVSGISSQFEEGYVTYSNEAKERLLGVHHETLEKFGAVSEETAREMALGARHRAGADISVISTGIAGPEGGTKEKPVGLVYLGCALGDNVAVERHIFPGNRWEVRHASTQAALQLLEKVLTEDKI